MSVIERDVVLIGKDEDGNECIDLPITRLGNIEDTADTKEALADNDHIPLVDSADNGKMKKIPWSAFKNTMPANFTVTVTDGVADKTFAEIAAAVDAGKSIRLLDVDTENDIEELFTFAGYGQGRDFLLFFNIINSYLSTIEIGSDEALREYGGAISLYGHDHDNRYLKLTGGTVNGDVTIGKDHFLTITSILRFYSGEGGISIYEESNDAEHPVLSFYGMNGDECVQLDHIETPASDYQAANKKYVDNAVKASRIATGSYNGTGTYGVDNPCSLTFDFVPKIVLIMTGKAFAKTSANDGSGFAFIACYINGHSTMWDITTNPYRSSNQQPEFLNTVSAEGNSISWYCDSEYEGARGQLNLAGFPYRYFAIG